MSRAQCKLHLLALPLFSVAELLQLSGTEECNAKLTNQGRLCSHPESQHL